MSSADRWDSLQRHVTAAGEHVKARRPEHTGVQSAVSVRELSKLQAHLTELIDREIIDARHAGAPWATLGTSKQQAYQRHLAALRRQDAAYLLDRLQDSISSATRDGTP